MILFSHGTNVVMSKAFSLLTQVDLPWCVRQSTKREHPNNQNKGIYPIDLVQDPSGMNPFLCPIGTT